MELSQLLLWLSLTLALLYMVTTIRRPHRLPPGPTPLPLVGSIFVLGRSPHRSLARLASIYGHVISLRLGHVTTVVVSSPAAAREVLQKKDYPLSARFIPDAIRVLGIDTASVIWMDPSGTRWRALKGIWRAHLSASRRLDAGVALHRRKTQELVAYMRGREGTEVNIGRAVFGTMLNVISNTAFSVDMVDIESELAQEFRDLVAGVLEETGVVNLSDFFPVLSFLDIQGKRRQMTKYIGKLFQIFDGIIDRRLETMRGVDFCGGSGCGDEARDLLDELIKLQHQENEAKIDRLAIKSMFTDMFTAGTDTISITVEWAMTELLRKPSVMAKARAEIVTTIGSKREVEELDITNLPYLQAVVKETLRLHPPGPLLVPHRAETDVDLFGYTIPAGTKVLVNVWAIGHDKDTWDDPEAFKPERFVGSKIDFRGVHFELIPFSSGRRICPGIQLAYQMLHVLLASLFHSFEWRLPEGMGSGNVDITERFGLTLAKAVPLRAVATSAF